jgi:hypothetical protein
MIAESHIRELFGDKMSLDEGDHDETVAKSTRDHLTSLRQGVVYPGSSKHRTVMKR